MLASLLLVLAAPLLAFSPPARADKTFTLEDSQRLALLNDPSVLSAEQDKIIAQQRVQEARFLFLPEIGVQASATKYDARYPFSLSPDFRNILLFPQAPNPYGSTTGNLYSGRGYMNLSLFEGGRTLNTLRLAKAADQQANTALESVKLDLRLSVQEIFYKLLLAQERVDATAQYQGAAEQLVGSARLKPWERVEAAALLAESQAKASSAAHKLDLARLAFLKGINVELDTAFSISGSLQAKIVHPDLDKLVLWAMELRPELQSETYRAQMDAISVNLAAARRIPTVFAAGDYEVTREGFPLLDNNWDISIGMRIPFAYDYFTQLRQKRAEQRQGQLKRAELQDHVRLEVRRAYEDLMYWQTEEPLRESRYKQVQGLYDEAGKQGGSALERLRGLGGVLDLKLDYLSAVTQHIIALARLERAVGRSLTP
ncbi:MAG: TolC family protein [Elusimicrobia bacterium]|nr:TolC family protein [Elusimicrobiota bacterium]MDE2425353.1 TolC family protein [Elusimicrobiota bacterium]